MALNDALKDVNIHRNFAEICQVKHEISGNLSYMKLKLCPFVNTMKNNFNKINKTFRLRI